MKKTYFLLTLGCQMNYYSSDQIHELMRQLGFVETKDKTETDVFIINACSVRQHAVDRIFGYFKQLDKKPVTIITGCVLPADQPRFKAKFDLILPIGDLGILKNFIIKRFPKVISNSKLEISNSSTCPISDRPIGEKDVYYVPIMEGCDNFCSYCAVPYTRGRERSRSEEEIIADVKSAITLGVKKIMLLGQNVNSYGKNLSHASVTLNAVKGLYNRDSSSRLGRTQNDSNLFKILLEKIEKLPGDFSYNFMSSNPKDFSNTLIKFLGKSEKWERKLHLPVQSGDDEVLKRMNRHYAAKQFLSLVSDLRSQISDLFISTDIIVGFPGETKKQFANTVSLCKKARFNHAFIARYSPRPGTAAAKMEDDVGKDEKKRRYQVLNQLINLPRRVQS